MSEFHYHQSINISCLYQISGNILPSMLQSRHCCCLFCHNSTGGFHYETFLPVPELLKKKAPEWWKMAKNLRCKTWGKRKCWRLDTSMYIYIYIKYISTFAECLGGDWRKRERERERQKKGVCLFARVNKGNSTMIHVENMYGLHDTPWTLKFPDELLLQLHHKRNHLYTYIQVL